MIHFSAVGRTRARSGETGGAVHPHWVRVWDLPTRLFHWTLVTLVAVGFVTGFLAPEWWLGLHAWAGFGLVALMLFRIAWGFFGTEYSRFANFVYPPGDVLAHLRGLLLLQPPPYVGHNPTGALMIFVLLGLLLALAATGLFVFGGEEKQGPLASVITYSAALLAKRAHPWLAGLLLTMVAGHLAGVAAESFLQGENLVRSMVTGWKRLPPDVSPDGARPARPVLAGLLCGVLATGVAGPLGWLSTLPPPHGLRTLQVDPTYRKECGACHYPHNPSLLPGASWAGLMASLDEHFGEDASLDTAVTRHLAEWLVANSAETFDTEAANRFRRVSAQAPYRITATPYWVSKHASIDPAVFRRAAIRSRVNCNACHGDAHTGRFADQAIAIPEEK